MEKDLIMESVNYIKAKIKCQPEIGVILGSGLGDMADNLENKEIVKYEDVPNLPSSTVKGHAGQFVFGTINGKNVVMMQGRIHFYEGNNMSLLSLPVYIMKFLGLKTLIVTNAAGGVNTSYLPGDLMLIKDHINFALTNPLIGGNDEKIGPRFPDMSEAYSRRLLNIAEKCAKTININVQKGVYCFMTGPSYETPAEIRMARILGGDAVGMSTVPEVIAARHCGIEVLGISCITNMAAGILDQPLNHAEVIETSNKVKEKFINYINELVTNI